MSDLSSTILRGTEQMTGATLELARSRNVRRQRMQAATRDASESLSDIGDTIKEFGSWKAAKQAEDEVRQIKSGLALGRATQGSKGVLIAAQGYRPTTKAGADALYEGTKDAESAAQKEMGVALDVAQAHHLEAQDEKIRDEIKTSAEERAERARILSKDDADWVETAEDQEIRDLFAAGGLKASNFISYREQRRKEREFKVKEDDKVKLATAAEAGRNARTKSNNETKTAVTAAQIASREKEGGANRTAAAERVKSQLDAAKSNADNALAGRLRAQVMRQEWEGSPENPMGQRLDILRDEQTRRWTRMRLDAKVKQLTLDRITALASGWNTGEDKAALVKSIEDEQDAVDDILGDIETYEKAAPKASPAAAKTGGPVEGATRIAADGKKFVRRNGAWVAE